MSRCACGTGTCSCIIKAAPDGTITVVGNGSPTRPYVIGVPGGNPLLNLDVVDDPTLNLTISGAGTATDKRKITGQATQSLTGLKDVRAGQPLVEGDIPVWRTNHWEFEPADAIARRITGHQPAEEAHRQHAVGEYVLETELLGEVEIDVDRIVVARATAIERKLVA